MATSRAAPFASPSKLEPTSPSSTVVETAAPAGLARRDLVGAGQCFHATLIEQAGADALVLDLHHVSADPPRDTSDIEFADLATIHAV